MACAVSIRPQPTLPAWTLASYNGVSPAVSVLFGCEVLILRHFVAPEHCLSSLIRDKRTDFSAWASRHHSALGTRMPWACLPVAAGRSQDLARLLRTAEEQSSVAPSCKPKLTVGGIRSDPVTTTQTAAMLGSASDPYPRQAIMQLQARHCRAQRTRCTYLWPLTGLPISALCTLVDRTWFMLPWCRRTSTLAAAGAPQLKHTLFWCRKPFSQHTEPSRLCRIGALLPLP